MLATPPLFIANEAFRGLAKCQAVPSEGSAVPSLRDGGPDRERSGGGILLFCEYCSSRKGLYCLADSVYDLFWMVEDVAVLKPNSADVVMPIQIISAYVILHVPYGGKMIMTI